MRAPVLEAFEEALRSRPEEIYPYTVRDYVAELKKYKPSTINRRLAALWAYFAWAIE